jgi:23S rRNA (guanine745-N1)-methyltransferase
MAVVIPPLACSVRACGLLLERRSRAYVCARRHTYDIARSGYVNLLQPTDRRSSKAGDRPEAIAARARLIARGIGTTLIDAIAERITLAAPREPVVVDLGSGSGELLAAVMARAADRSRLTAIGIDISTAAAEQAARRHSEGLWVVANADRRLPLLDRTVDVVVSVHGRRNPLECARVLVPGGMLLVAVPAPEDLIELRRVVQGGAVERPRDHTLDQAHAALFEVADRFDIRERHELEADSLRDLLRGTYRGERRSAAARIESLARLDVTLASTVIVFRLRASC